jgi:hypothetical protein
MEQASAAALLGIIVGHWDANENGTHRVREATFREDACRIARAQGSAQHGHADQPRQRSPLGPSRHRSPPSRQPSL